MTAIETKEEKKFINTYDRTCPVLRILLVLTDLLFQKNIEKSQWSPNKINMSFLVSHPKPWKTRKSQSNLKKEQKIWKHHAPWF